jgi:hypothetical protein
MAALASSGRVWQDWITPEDVLVNGKSVTRDQTAHPRRAVDHLVFMIACGFLALPLVAVLVSSSRSIGEETAFTTFAPFAAALVLIVLLLLVESVERRVAGARPGWPPALLGVPLACLASGLAFATVDPGGHQLAAGLAGLAWGIATAAIGWRRWRTHNTDGVL